MSKMTTCDQCGAPRNTLYDNMKLTRHFLLVGMVCLDCVPDWYRDSNYPGRAFKLSAAAVTGGVNIEKRRRAIQKRT